MKLNSDEFWPIMLVVGMLLIAFALGSSFGKFFQQKAFEEEAVKQGVADYNPTNGQWQWKPCK